MFSKKGLMNKKERKIWNLEGEDKRKTRKKQNKKKRRISKRGLLGEQKTKNL